MSKHTAGPWSVENDTDIAGIENDPANGCFGPVDVAHVYLRTVPGRTEANANLIAAAPDLLTALRDMMSTLADGPDDSDVARVVNKARAAIFKATGGAAFSRPLTDEKYNELLFAVGNKYPGETRHETALRYIRQAEMYEPEPAKSIEAANGIGDKV
jgi:hypothetical protein